MYLCAPLALSAAVRWDGSTLSKPPLMSRKREETLRSSRWKRRTSWASVAGASKVDRPGREPVWWGWRRPQDLARRERREVVTLSTILERVSRRTMTLKEAGESYEALPGLSKTTPLAFLREAGWWPYWRRGPMRFVRRAGQDHWTFFQTS